MRFNLLAALFVAQGVVALPYASEGLTCEASPVPEICCSQQRLECIRDGLATDFCTTQQVQCVADLVV